MTLLPPLTTPQQTLHFPGVIRAPPRNADEQHTTPLVGAAPAPRASQADRQHENGSFRPRATNMPQNYTGERPGSPRRQGSNGAAGIHRSNSASFSRRPSSAPRGDGSGGTNNTTDDEDENRALSLRPQKPPLLRSQSAFAGPNRDDAEHDDQEDIEWGTRHGFDDHYQSEDIISQLANVSLLFFSASQRFVLPSGNCGGKPWEICGFGRVIDGGCG